MKNENIDRVVLLSLLLIAMTAIGYLIGSHKNKANPINTVSNDVKIDTTFSNMSNTAKAHYADSVAASKGH
jgi:hypothetical protein